MRMYKSGVDEAERNEIRNAYYFLLEVFSKKLNKPPEAIAQEVRYCGETSSNPYRTHATDSERLRSFRHYQGLCQYPGCSDKSLKSWKGRELVEYHHLRRGVPNLHEPENLVPMHPECHRKASED
jgi:5-methylcytosine-specific restriction endonuclease McrA